MIPTPHINVTDAAQIAQTILLPGDPLRAKYIAEVYLKDVQCFNTTRNMLGYTGTWNGQRVSVMGTGMGMPSMGIYSYELIHFCGVKRLIRIGSCGSLQQELKIRDIVVAMSASHDSGYAAQYHLPGTYAPTASFSLLRRAAEKAEKMKLSHVVGNIISSDLFYSENHTTWRQWAKMGILAIEMEAAALYMNAARAGVDAICLLTVSDSLVSGERLLAEERETSFNDMVQLALNLL